MKKNKIKKEEYYETLVQNAQKGEHFLVKLKDDPVIYNAIPIIRPNFESKDDNAFIFNVIKPEEQKGVYKKSLEEIDVLVKEDL